MKRTPREQIPGQYAPSRIEDDLDAAFRQRARRLLVLDAAPTGDGAEGEIVAVWTGSAARLYVYLGGAWRYVALT